MRHLSSKSKLKRNASQRRALLSGLTCNLIEHGRIKTTLGKAKALRPVAEKMVTLAKKGDIHSRRIALAFLRQKDIVAKLFATVAPAAANRPGGYCRITKLAARLTDAAPMAYIEFCDTPLVVTSSEPTAADAPAAEEKSEA